MAECEVGQCIQRSRPIRCDDGLDRAVAIADEMETGIAALWYDRFQECGVPANEIERLDGTTILSPAPCRDGTTFMRCHQAALKTMRSDPDMESARAEFGRILVA